jgi:hypothetical protein
MTALVTAALALIGIYIAFSLFASWTNEQLATIIGLRSKTLVAGLHAMIGEAATAEVFGHPLISSLGEKLGSTRGIARLEPFLSRFTAKVVGVRYAGGSAVRVDSTAPAGPAGVRLTPYVPSTLFASVVTDIVRSYGNAGQSSASAANLGAGWSDLVAGLDALKATPSLAPLQQALAPMWREAQGDYDAFAGALASWYDAHMDRVTGWYKRSAQLMLVWIATIVVILFNVDTLQMWNGFEANVNLANAVAGITQAYAGANSGAIEAGKPVNPVAQALPTQSCEPGTQGPTCACPAGFMLKAGATDTCTVDASVLTRLPLGWSGPYLGPFEHGFADPNFWKKLVMKLLGLLVTIVALMLGAPFWFDLLRSIVNVRSAGPPPQPAPSSPST